MSLVCRESDDGTCLGPEESIREKHLNERLDSFGHSQVISSKLGTVKPCGAPPHPL